MILALALSAAGFYLAWKLFGRLAPGEATGLKLAGSAVLGVMLSSWASLLFFLALGGLSGNSILSATGLLLLAGKSLDFLFPQQSLRSPQKNFPQKDFPQKNFPNKTFLQKNSLDFSFAKKIFSNPDLRLAALLVLFGLLFGLLFSTRMLEPAADGLYSGGSTWGDLALHLTLANSFLQGSNSAVGFANLRELQYPVFPPALLTYPFLIDFHAAALAAGGLSLRDSLVFPGVLLSLCLVCLLYFFFKQFCENGNAAFVAVLLVFLAGGLGFYHFFQDAAGQGLPPLDYLLTVSKDYTRLPEAGLDWSNLVADSLLPQRGQLVALPASFVVFFLLLKNLDEQNVFARKNRFVLAGIVAGLVPLFQMHALLSVAVVSGTLFLASCIDSGKGFGGFKQKFSEWLWFGFPLVVLAAPQVAWVGQQLNPGFLSIALGWHARGMDLGWLAYWLKNLGVVFALSFIALFAASAKQKKFFLPFLALFALGNLFSFQPYLYDNIKLFFHWFVAACGLAALMLARLWENKNLFFKAAAGLLFLSAVFSGVLSITKEANSHWLLYSTQDLKLAEFVKQNTPRDALFLSSDRHDHWLPGLAGRKIVLGYRGWLWTHGFDYLQREKEVREMFSGAGRARELMKQYKVDYAVVGQSELRDFAANEEFFRQSFQLIKNTSGARIYLIGG